MNINMKLYTPFIASVNRLREKYGEEFEKLNGFHNQNLNFTDFIDNFIDSTNVADATIDSNANSNTHDIKTLMSDMMKPHTKLLSYNKIFYELVKFYGIDFANKWLEEEWNGAFYLHNASQSSFTPYCFAFDLQDIVDKGLFFINNFKPTAPKHLTTFNDHTLEFISWTSNRMTGAVGIPSYLIHSYYFWYNDVKTGHYMKDPEYYREQCFQKFIYDLNQPYLRTDQCAFTNVSILDRSHIIEFFGERKYPDGSYILDHLDGIIEHQKSFMRTVAKIRHKCFMTFPVLSYCLLFDGDKFEDEEFAKWCVEHNMEWSDSNFLFAKEVTSLASCCRLTSDVKGLKGFINSIGGTSLSIGSLQVNTIPLRRIAIESNKDKNKFLSILEDRVNTSIKVLHVIRNIIKRNIEKGLLPNYSYGLIKLENQYNTIGITAMYEAIREFGLIEIDKLGNHKYSDEGIDFAIKILDKINELKDNITYDYSINLEVVPGERANIISCEKDSLLYGNKYDDFIYSNQWIPLMTSCSLDEKIRLSAILDGKCGGGQIQHIGIDGKFANFDQAWEMTNYIAKSGVIYMAYNPKISTCSEGHGFYGEKCPTCGGNKVDEFSRVVGYLTPKSAYSKPRRKEFQMRQWYNLND